MKRSGRGDPRIPEARVRMLNGLPPALGDYVLYWMQQSQRAACNHALEYAVLRANAMDLPVLVGFGLTAKYPDANLRHYRFMLEGLAEVREVLARRGIGFVVRYGDPAEVALGLTERAALVVCDRGVLRHQKLWRRKVARGAGRAVVEIETDVVVPVGVVSEKAEYAARTIRPRLERNIEEYLAVPGERRPRAGPPDASHAGLDLDDIDAVLAGLDVDTSVPPVTHRFRGGLSEARRRLRAFMRRLRGYAEERGQPEAEHVSHLSMYLHFGQISPIEVALAARGSSAPSADRDAFLEELIVRRELAHNFVEYTPEYDRFESVPEWARKTLAKHRKDRRPHRYTKPQLDAADTHDPWWNAAMREMKYTGYMHNHMRMYWGKKIIEWSASAERAYRVIAELNNRYFLDGRDPASWANIGWLFGLHDRPWPERPVFGTVRWMSAEGLERKVDVAAYAAKVDERVAEAKAAGVRFDDD